MEHVFEFSRAKIGALKTEISRVDFYKRLYEICSIINCSDLRVFWVDKAQTGFSFIQSEPNKFNNCFKVFDKEIASQVAVMKNPVLIDSLVKYRAKNPKVVYELKAGVTSTLAYPVLDGNAKTIAVIQFDKTDGSKFNSKDVDYTEELVKWLSFYIEQQFSAHNDKVGYDLNQYLSSKLLDFFNGVLTFEQMIGYVGICLRHFLENDFAFFYEIALESANKLAKGFYVEVGGLKNESMVFEKVSDFILIKDETLLADVLENYDFTEYFSTADNENFVEKLDTNIFDFCDKFDIRSCALVPICYAENLFGVMVLINPAKMKHIYEVELISNYMGQGMFYKYLKECLDYEQNRCSVIKETLHNCISNKKSFSTFKWYTDIGPNFDSIVWRIEAGDDNLLAYVYYIFKKLFAGTLQDDYIKKFLSSCLITHRDKTYHNFKLTFRIVRTIYCILLHVGQHLTLNEKIGLMISAALIYCDHNSLDNDVMIRLEHPLSKIFPKHHKKERKRIWLGNLILENSNLLESFLKEDASKIFTHFSEIIFSNSNWNSSIYFEKVREALVNPEYEFTIDQKKHRKFVLNLVFRCGLQARHVQEFNMVKELCEDLFKEYFDIGDMELASGFQPTPRKNRENFHRIPEFELQYINDHVIPLFEILNTLFPNTSDFLKCVRNVAKAYEIVLGKEGKSLWSQDKSIGKSMSDRLCTL